jgi:hypothetical protein
MPNSSDQYLIAKSQSDSSEDLIGRLLFQLVELQSSSDARIGALEQSSAARHKEMMRYEHAGVLQKKIGEKILKEIREAIASKEIDLSEVLAGMEMLVKTQERSRDSISGGLQGLGEHFPHIRQQLEEIARILNENKPKEVILDEVIESQEAGYKVIGRLLVKIGEEIKKKEFPKEVALSKPVKIEKPTWWKDFNFSWEPLEKLLDKITSKTFKVKADNPIEVEVKGLPKEVAKELSKELTRILPQLMSRAGYNHPFDFDEAGNLKVVNLIGASETLLAQIRDYVDARTKPTDIQLGELIPVMRNIFQAIANPSYVDKSANAIRNQVQSGTITTVTTVTGLTNIDSYQGKLLIINQNISAWANNVRARIS